MEPRAFQDELAEAGFYHCWGCGSQNEHGLQIKSYWDDGDGICTWQPQPYHQAWPGIVNGGILATIIDCHSACTATAAAYRAENRAMNTPPLIAFVTAALQISYLRPTPITEPLLLRAVISHQTRNKIRLTCVLTVQGQTCVRAEAVMVRLRAKPGAGG
ncbi:MAG TPA: PaaI family thioesterase [Ktedonobacterales bacterium]